MYGIDVLLEEHENIRLALGKMRKTAIDIMNGNKVNEELIRSYIDFVRNYADKHHHGKEELILFKIMMDNLGAVATKLIQNGMLVEHDLGRLYIMNLESALNQYFETFDDNSRVEIIANLISYTNLLTRHIEKENTVVYTFGERELSKELLKEVDEKTLKFENENAGIREKYISWLNN